MSLLPWTYLLEVELDDLEDVRFMAKEDASLNALMWSIITAIGVFICYQILVPDNGLQRWAVYTSLILAGVVYTAYTCYVTVAIVNWRRAEKVLRERKMSRVERLMRDLERSGRK